MIARLAVLLALLVCTGCAGRAVNSRAVNFLKEDLDAAALVSQAGMAQGLLTITDPWVRCASALSATVTRIQLSVGIVTPTNGIFAEAARLHILDTVAQSFPPDIQASCGQVFFDIMLRAGKRAPGL